MPARDPVWGLVLAGGESRRMGTDKALLERDGTTQLSRCVSLLDRHLERTFVSARAQQKDEPERSRYSQIIDRRDDIGPVAGILAALEKYPDVGWLVLACDLPNVDDATIEFLLENRSGETPFTAFRSTFDGLPEPLCAIYRPDARAIIAQFVRDGVICPRKILIRSDTHLLDQPSAGALDNVNTPEDLARAGMQAS